jgi:hypothetical protein
MKRKEELKKRLQKALKGLSQHERREAIRRLNNYVAHLEYVQQMDVVMRLSYWECAYAVFDYLRRNKQLGRNVGKFDAEVKQVLDDIIRELWYDGPTED